jgi:hypothetical protein
MGSAQMMQERVEHELHMKSVRSREEGDLPAYLEDEEDEVGVIRMAPGAGGELTPVEDDS